MPHLPGTYILRKGRNSQTINTLNNCFERPYYTNSIVEVQNNPMIYAVQKLSTKGIKEKGAECLKYWKSFG